MLLIESLYFASALLLALYGFTAILFTGLYWKFRRDANHRTPAPALPMPVAAFPSALGTQMPLVTVQLPVYNERHVVERLISAVVALDWPSQFLQIQILDDSTDDTTAMISAVISRLDLSGIDLEHIHRTDRQGYKAGALQGGLGTATGEYIAIFDADFVPLRDFLRKTVPLFADANVGCVQTRWGHLNRDSSQLTQSEALGIDGHFIVEQSVRNRIGAFLNFNGTAGVWRRSCMESAGGWQGDTLTEDLDLSYRAQLGGWRIAYQGEVIVPAELPVQIEAFKRQQFRWAKGSIQTAMKLLGRLWRAPEPLWRKLLGTLHLTNYAVHPLMLLNLLLLLPMSFSESAFLHAAPLLTIAAVGPPSMYWTAMSEHKSPLWRRLKQLGTLMALGMGLSLNNSRAVLEAVSGMDSEFKRTPKFAVTANPVQWQSSTYVLARNPIVWMELALAIYSLAVLAYCLINGIWWVSLWVLLYAAGYSYIAYLAFLQAWQLARSHRRRFIECGGALEPVEQFKGRSLARDS